VLQLQNFSLSWHICWLGLVVLLGVNLVDNHLHTDVLGLGKTPLDKNQNTLFAAHSDVRLSGDKQKKHIFGITFSCVHIQECAN
jgi:hypothetical protein